MFKSELFVHVIYCMTCAS